MSDHIPAKKSLGQNFLKSKEALRAIVDAGSVTSTDTILEIGPGKGVLTAALLEKAGKVLCVEKDARLTPVLQEVFSKEIEVGKLEILEQDILEFIPEQHSLRAGEYKIIANIPYYITGLLLEKFLSGITQPSLMVLLVQKEVADRIIARDGKESILSMSVRAYGTPKYVMTVKAKYFSPAPKVDSAVILISNISKNNFKDIAEETFFTLVKAGFAHKRKMLLGNIKHLFEGKNLEEIFEKEGIAKTARAETLAVDDWLKLCRHI